MVASSLKLARWNLIASDPTRPATPALPLPVAQLLAHTCSSLLYTLELSAFIEGQCQRLDYPESPRHQGGRPSTLSKGLMNLQTKEPGYWAR